MYDYKYNFTFYITYIFAHFLHDGQFWQFKIKFILLKHVYFALNLFQEKRTFDPWGPDITLETAAQVGRVGGIFTIWTPWLDSVPTVSIQPVLCVLNICMYVISMKFNIL